MKWKFVEDARNGDGELGDWKCCGGDDGGVSAQQWKVHTTKMRCALLPAMTMSLLCFSRHLAFQKWTGTYLVSSVFQPERPDHLEQPLLLVDGGNTW